MKHPLVSVHMITYNHAPFIARAIEGVLQQKTNFPVELIIGEDCSTDGTREIVFDYQKKYPGIVRVVTSDKNVGMKKNSTRTLRACRGKYVAYCEGDDYWHRPDKLQKQAGYLETHPECGLVYTDFDAYDVQTKKRVRNFITHKKIKILERPTLEWVLHPKGMHAGIFTWTLMMRRSLCMQITEADPYLHQSDHFLMGDTQLIGEAVMMTSCHYIPESMATRNLLQESATRSRDVRKTLKFHLSAVEMCIYLLSKHPVNPEMHKEYEEYWCDVALHLAFHSRNRELADTAKTRLRTLTSGQQLLYYGATIAALYYPLYAAVLFRRMFRRSSYIH